MNDLDLAAEVGKSRKVGVGGRGHHVVDEGNVATYVLLTPVRIDISIFRK